MSSTKRLHHSFISTSVLLASLLVTPQAEILTSTIVSTCVSVSVSASLPMVLALAANQTSAHWTAELELYLDKDGSDNAGSSLKFTHAGLKKSIHRYIGNPVPIVKEAIYFRNPLASDGSPTGVWWIYHAFLVLRTNDGFWSFENGREHITVQRSDSISGVVSSWGKMVRRNATYVQSKDCRKAKTIANVFDDIIVNNELSHIYHVFNDNCIGFADRLYGTF